ncbi:MAG TPA: serine hydrolase domain-containing protein [Phnomibacter sp.]|nr:serine hydrolase domain-containing protein [Phnomibacter sp.]
MKKLIIFFFLVSATLMACRKEALELGTEPSNTVPWSDSSSRHPKAAQYLALIEKYRKQGFPGISLLVDDRYGTWVGSTGYADLGAKTPFGVSQVSKIASITKLFVGTMIFKLIEDSVNTKVNYSLLNDPISKWLPDRIVSKLPNGKSITLGDCMKHETGIPNIEENDKFYLAVLNQPTRIWEPEEILEFVYGMDPHFKPRDTAIYSSTNTTIVAMVAEAVTGRKHNDLIKQYIFTPLGMNQTFYQNREPLPKTAAQGYYDLYNNSTLANVSNIIPGSGNGYGGHFSNVFDMWKFIRAMYIERTLLSAHSLSVMNTWGEPDEPNRYGYGSMLKFIQRGIDAGIGHSGRDLGYTANLFWFPNRNVSHTFVLNYGTNGDSKLRPIFRQFEQELIDLTFQ